MFKRIFAVLPAMIMFTAFVAAAPPVQKSDLRVLYVGGSPEFEPMSVRNATPEETARSAGQRMASFEKFLEEYFKSVTVIKAEDYTQDMSGDYDVTVMDGLPEPILPAFADREKGINLPEGYLTEDFDRPILTIGYISDHIGRRIGTKHDWYCLCLMSDALRWKEDHPIFHGPFEVKLTVEEKPTPEPIFSFPHYFPEGKVPETMPMWRVQTYDFDSDERVRIGLVSRPGGYEDSPEAELISGGVSQKSPDAVAIGRHGNFFHWGFAASPDNMTEQAKPVLANAIVYISRFAGQTPIARKYNDRAPTRESVPDRKQFLSREAWQQSEAATESWNARVMEIKARASAKRDRGEELDQMEQIYLNMEPTAPTSYENYLRQSAGSLFAIYGTDLEGYSNYFDDNYDYFYSDGGYELLVDEDARSIGIPNNDHRILDEAIRMLETGSDPDKGKRLLLRYTLVDYSAPGEWRRWYDANKEKLFFTESGGWVFLVDNREPGANDYKAFNERRMAGRIDTGQTNDNEPVAVAADISVSQDGSRVLNIKFAIHPGYHLYDNVAGNDVFIPTSVIVELPEGYRTTGPLKKPAGSFYSQSGTTVFKDSVLFSQEFSGDGPGEVICRVEYQCCDLNICFPPQTREFTFSLN